MELDMFMIIKNLYAHIPLNKKLIIIIKAILEN